MYMFIYEHGWYPFIDFHYCNRSIFVNSNMVAIFLRKQQNTMHNVAHVCRKNYFIVKQFSVVTQLVQPRCRQRCISVGCTVPVRRYIKFHIGLYIYRHTYLYAEVRTSPAIISSFSTRIIAPIYCLHHWYCSDHCIMHVYTL